MLEQTAIFVLLWVAVCIKDNLGVAMISFSIGCVFLVKVN